MSLVQREFRKDRLHADVVADRNGIDGGRGRDWASRRAYPGPAADTRRRGCEAGRRFPGRARRRYRAGGISGESPRWGWRLAAACREAIEELAWRVLRSP